MPLVDVYTNAVYRNLRPLYANWEPSAPVALGDYGEMDGTLFKRLGNLKQFGIGWTETKPTPSTRRSFGSSKSVSVSLVGSGQAAPSACAQVQIGFGGASGVYVDAAECRYSAVADKRALGEALRTTGRFDRSWAVVTDVIVAERTIVAVSNGSNAQVVLEAEAGVPAINLSNARLGLNVTTRRNIGYLVEAERGLTPFIGLCRFRRKFFREDDFRVFGRQPRLGPLSARADGPAEPSDLDFVQLT